MKKRSIVAMSLCIFLCYCNREIALTLQEKNEATIIGKWHFVSFTDTSRKAVTNADKCWADNTLEFKDDHTATISQGICIETPLKPKDIDFKWAFISDDMVDFGGDTVKLILNNDTALQFQRINKSFLEYKWKR